MNFRDKQDTSLYHVSFFTYRVNKSPLPYRCNSKPLLLVSGLFILKLVRRNPFQLDIFV